MPHWFEIVLVCDHSSSSYAVARSTTWRNGVDSKNTTSICDCSCSRYDSGFADTMVCVASDFARADGQNFMSCLGSGASDDDHRPAEQSNTLTTVFEP